MSAPTATEVITGDRALELLREVVAAAGANFVYRKPDAYDVCVYAFDGCPSCMVGHALLAAGAELEDLELLGDGSIKGVSRVGRLWLEWDAAAVFDAAQALQDRGEPWGVALQAAADVFDGLDYALPQGGAA